MTLSIVHLYGWAPCSEDRLAVIHRMQRPLDLLADTYGVRGLIYSTSHPYALQAARAADVVVLHLATGFAVEALILERRRAGLPTVFELGDDPSGYRFWAREPKRSVPQLQAVYHTASICDGVQFSTPGLAAKFEALHPRRAVLPLLNAIPSALPEKPERFTIGWGGSTSHRDDLLSIAPILTDFCKQHPDVQLAVIGNPEMLRELFQEVSPHQFHVQAYESQAQYEQYLQRLHVGLAPLRDTAVNRGRTDLKLVEYGSAGAVVIAQVAPAFAPLQPLTLGFTSGQELRTHLERCYSDRDFCARQAERMLHHLQKTRDAASVVSTHWAWYSGLAGPSRSSGKLPQASQTADRAHARLTDPGVTPAELEDMLRSLLESMPEYDECRLRLCKLLASQQRWDELVIAVRPLLRSRFWHDDAQLLLAGRGKQSKERVTRWLRSPLLRAERTAYKQDSLLDYFAAIQDVAPMHYFMLGYMRHAAPSPQQRCAAAERLALYDTSR